MARRVWRVLEVCHAVTYFTPEARSAFATTGLRGTMMTYVAGRVAPMGAVGAGAAAAVLYNLNPTLVGRAVPRAWDLARPGDVVSARALGAGRALERMLGPAGSARTADVHAAAGALRTACALLDPGARPLLAANADLMWPEDPLLALWHGATLLREHRGDAHASVLAHEQVPGCQAHMLAIAATGIGDDWVRYRGWSAAECQGARARLRERGLLGADGRLTVDGARTHARIERHTDRLADPPWDGDAGRARATAVLRVAGPMADRIAACRQLPVPYPPVG